MSCHSTLVMLSPMIKLYTFGPAFGLIDPSPFVAKVHLFMTLNKIAFETESDARLLAKAPKKKFPVINDDGKIIADSSFILKHLSEKYKIDMDASLNDTQRATAYHIGKSLEENLYWCLVHSRWMNDDTWPIIKQQFFNDLPFPLNKIVPAVVRNGTRKRINGHGMGAHTDDEINAIANESFASVSTLLGNKAYLFGDTISTLDLIIFAQIGAFTLSIIDNKAARIAKEYDNLVGLTQRIQHAYYPKLNTNN